MTLHMQSWVGVFKERAYLQVYLQVGVPPITVGCFLYYSVLNEKENNGQPPNMNFVPTALPPTHSLY